MCVSNRKVEEHFGDNNAFKINKGGKFPRRLVVEIVFGCYFISEP